MIKFRAFIDGEMIEADCLAFEEYAPLSDQLGSCPTLMQYTGVNDKNGKEIYFGDILTSSFGTKTVKDNFDYAWLLDIETSILFEITGNIYENGDK